MRGKRFIRVHVVFRLPRRELPVFERLLELVEEKAGARVEKQWAE